jgi:hypothetical protein
MCLPYAEAIGAFVAAAVSVATLLIYGGAGPDLRQLSHLIRTRIFLLGVFAAIFAIGGWWTVRTWKQLWRYGRSPWERAVYDYGVRFVGIYIAVGQLLILTWLGWISDARTLFGPLMVGGAIAALFFGVAVSLHFGYFVGRALATVVAAERDPRVEVGEPPHLT